MGYARVSKFEQNLDLQTDALKSLGIEKISGATKNRPELDKMLEQFRQGDELYVWRLDRLGRSLKHIIEMVLSLC
nr:recombinase family protein [Chryseobacterium sp. G0240]